ncbi:MAG: cell division protein FtsL [Stellaceae bacterium]
MIRPSTALWGAAVILVGYAMFQVKYEVMQQEDQLAHVRREVAQGREQIRVLKAEWSFLSQPTRLNELAHRYLDLVPIGTAQLGAIDTIPLRNPPPGAAAVATLTPGAAP